jgi:hypothetical protein
MQMSSALKPNENIFTDQVLSSAEAGGTVMPIRSLFLTALLLISGFAFAQEECLVNEKTYNQAGFEQDDFLDVDESVLIGDDLRLNTDQELDTENLLLTLDQPFIVDYLSEGAGASHQFGFFFFDIDTDKDGIPDFYETGPTDDLDGDLILNQDDSDIDNDGIPNASDTGPDWVTNTMAASFFKQGQTALDNSPNGTLWPFIPSSETAEFIFEHPTAYIYVDNDNNQIPDALEYTTGANTIPPFGVETGFRGQHRDIPAINEGLLGRFPYAGTPGETVDDTYHWTGEVIFRIADDDGGGPSGDYWNYSPYITTLITHSDGTNASPDYMIYDTADPSSTAIPDLLKDDNDTPDDRSDDTFLVDNRGVEFYRYRWYKSDISGARELVFFLVVYWGSGGSRVNTYYSKSGFNPDTPPSTPGRNGATNGDQFGESSINNWFPHHRNQGDHDTFVNNRFYPLYDQWSDIATAPSSDQSPVAHDPTMQEYVDEWENWRADRRILQYRALRDWFNQTAVDANDVIFNRYNIDMSAEGDSAIVRTINGQMAHLLVGAPQSTQNAWLLGWEDLFRGGDRDYEDVVFYVKREAGGALQSFNVAQHLQDEFEDFSLSLVSFTFQDNFVDGLWGTEGRYINYSYKLGSADPWTYLLGGRHERDPDLFQPASGGQTETSGGTVTRTITLEIQDKKQEIYWRVEMATDNVDTFSPEVNQVQVEYQTLVHDFYYHSATVSSSNVRYIANRETPDNSWLEKNANRGHLYAQRIFDHGPVPTSVEAPVSPELTPESQPPDPFFWDAGVSMREQIGSRTIYTYLQTEGSDTHSNSLELQQIDFYDVSPELIEALELSSETENGVFIYNFHDPGSSTFDETSAGMWLYTWASGYLNPSVSEGSINELGPEREWALGGIYRGAPVVVRSPGLPDWVFGPAIPFRIKEALLEWIDDPARRYMPTKVLLTSEWGFVHAIDAGQWVPDKANEEDEWVDGSYNDFGTGQESWAMIPGHLLDDLKHNYAGTSPVTAKIEATANHAVVYNETTEQFQRIVVFSQGFRGGTHRVNGETRTGNVVWAMDVSDIENPLPLWHFSAPEILDQTGIVSIAWVETDTTRRWVVFTASGVTPIPDTPPKLFALDAFTGEQIDDLTVEVDVAGEVLAGSPALVDADNNGLIDHAIFATSSGRLTAFNLKTRQQSFVELPGASFYVTPNARSTSDGQIAAIVVSGDNPFYYDTVETYGSDSFTNNIYYYFYNPDSGEWNPDASLGQIPLEPGHRIISRPFAFNDTLFVATTTGDTHNICDPDSDDPGGIYQVDLNTGEIVSEIGIGAFTADINPEHGNPSFISDRSPRDDPQTSGSAFKSRATNKAERREIEGNLPRNFGVVGSVLNLMTTSPTVEAPPGFGDL